MSYSIRLASHNWGSAGEALPGWDSLRRRLDMIRRRWPGGLLCIIRLIPGDSLWRGEDTFGRFFRGSGLGQGSLTFLSGGTSFNGIILLFKAESDTPMFGTQEFRKKMPVAWPLPRVTGPLLQVPIIRYTGTSEEPRWMDGEPGKFEIISHISADLSKASCTPGVSRLGFPSFTRECEVILLCNNTKLMAQLAWKEDPGGVKHSGFVLLYGNGEHVQEA
ncbi:hypothetical protein BJ322DRAFT_873863 [Thelephora terrestris]|uniref:Uncharacterized protein n=1 Tax=Thelephora terrestris TaxID=56493 RepID=A0A9P6HDV5_9AGAM|nr:hypothetical protein BJ322DRAFT_873863 [Thelephora terrestris]